MSAENGSIGQYKAFYGERVTLPTEVLTLEAVALAGFDFEKIFSNYSFPPAFWTSLRILIEKISKLSTQTVSKTEEKITADTLLTAFGTVTTEETIQPHSELTTKVKETYANLTLTLTESRLVFATLLAQIKQTVIAFHQEQLQAIPTQEADEKVANYLSRQGQQSNSVITTSLENSQRAFNMQQKKREESRRRVKQSLKIWMGFISETTQTVLGGTTASRQQLKGVTA